MRKFVLGLTISFVLVMAAMVYAQGRGMMGEGPEMGQGFMGRGPGMMGGEHHLLKKLMSLGLDEQQQGAVKAIVRTAQKETIKKRADLAVAQIEMKDLLDEDPVNMPAVEAKLKQIEALKTDIRLSHIRTFEAVKAKLTPDQRKKLKEMKDHGMMGKMGMMKHKRCGMMDGMKGGMKCGMMGGMKGGMMGGMKDGMKDGMMQHDQMQMTPQSPDSDDQMETAPQSSGDDEDMPDMEHQNN